MTWSDMTEKEKILRLLDVAFSIIVEGKCWVAGSRVIVVNDDPFECCTIASDDVQSNRIVEPFDPLHSLDDAWSVLTSAFPGAQALLHVVPPQSGCTIILPGSWRQAALAMAETPCEAICQAVLAAAVLAAPNNGNITGGDGEEQPPAAHYVS